MNADSRSTAAKQPGAHRPKETVKETLISIVIAFVLAFVGRGFVIEAFVIPTGSMAPTLLGAHMRFQGEASGRSWAVGPWNYQGQPAEPKPIQGQAPDRPVVVHDPANGQPITRASVRRSSGDRILVLKYLYAIQDPERFDVVVFKNPHNDPEQNYIKRLIGLPREEVALVDGDVFTRPLGESEAAPSEPPERGGSWQESGWRIARKPARVQRAVWQEVFSSECAPLPPPEGTTGAYAGAVTGFECPWVCEDGSIQTSGRIYMKEGAAESSTLRFDQSRKVQSPMPPYRWEQWSIDDRYPFNESPPSWSQPRYPVSDVRMRLGVEPLGEAAITVTAVLEARGHEFQVVIGDGKATARMRLLGTEGDTGWVTLATGDAPALSAGHVSNIEVWHADQAVWLFVDGRAVIEQAGYEWSPGERLRFSTGKELTQLLEQGGRPNVLKDASLYRRPEVRWVFAGAGAKFQLHRVGLDRDLHYQPGEYGVGGGAALATSPLNALRLKADQFFTCGDNSPASLDGRLWEEVAPWVGDQIDATRGIVPRDLLLGKAFFVYFPSLKLGGSIPIPDFGRMRFIW